MKLKELFNLLKEAAGAGAQKVLAGSSALPEYLTKSQAYRLYGRSDVDRWLQEGLLTLKNSKINRTNMERVSRSSNRTTYLPVADR